MSRVSVDVQRSGMMKWPRGWTNKKVGRLFACAVRARPKRSHCSHALCLVLVVVCACTLWCGWGGEMSLQKSKAGQNAKEKSFAVIKRSSRFRHDKPSLTPTDSCLLPIYVIQEEEERCLSYMLVGWTRQNSAPSSSSFFLSQPLKRRLPLLLLLLLLLPTMTPAFLLPSITSARMLRRSVSSWLKRGGATPKSRPCLSPSSVGLHSSSSYNPLFDDVPDRR